MKLILCVCIGFACAGEVSVVVLGNADRMGPKLSKKLVDRFADPTIKFRLNTHETLRSLETNMMEIWEGRFIGTNGLNVCFSKTNYFPPDCTWRVGLGDSAANADIVLSASPKQNRAWKLGKTIFITAGSASNEPVPKKRTPVPATDDLCPANARPALLHLLFSKSEFEFAFHGDNGVGGSPLCKVRIVHASNPAETHPLTIAAPNDLPVVRIAAFGDWGEPGEAMDDFVRGLARTQMDAVWLLGDNFYPLGIDRRLGVADPRWRDFTAMAAQLSARPSIEPVSETTATPTLTTSKEKSTQMTMGTTSNEGTDKFVEAAASPLLFYAVLGNHDYAGSAQAQVDYSRLNPQWVMPARYYFRRFALGLCVWFLDTDLGRFDQEQAQWMVQSAEINQDTCTWFVAAGHHLVYSGGDRKDNPALGQRLLPILQRFDFDLYVCGHEHQSQVLRDPRFRTLFVVAGASSEVLAPTETKKHPFLLFMDSTKQAWLSLAFTPASLAANLTRTNGSVLWQSIVTARTVMRLLCIIAGMQMAALATNNLNLLVFGDVDSLDQLDVKMAKKVKGRFSKPVSVEFIGKKTSQLSPSFRQLTDMHFTMGVWYIGKVSEETSNWLDQAITAHSDVTWKIVLADEMASTEIISDILKKHHVHAYVSSDRKLSQLATLRDHPTRFALTGTARTIGSLAEKGYASSVFSNFKRRAFLQIMGTKDELVLAFHQDNSVGADPIGGVHITRRAWVVPSAEIVPLDRLDFVAFGDWGLPGDEFDRFTDKLSSQTTPSAVWLLGDNFYPLGIDWDLGLDDPRFGDFTKLAAAMGNPNLKYYTILGNHDYSGNVQAQVDYSRMNAQWVMPTRFYFRRFMQGSVSVCVWFLDTDKGRFDEQQAEWMAQSVDTNKETCTWLVAVGHHHVYSGGDYSDNIELVTLLVPILSKHNFDLYLSGHEHQSQVLQNPALPTLFVVAGASAEMREPEEESEPQPFLQYMNYRSEAFLRLEITELTFRISFQKASSKSYFKEILWERTLRKDKEDNALFEWLQSFAEFHH